MNFKRRSILNKKAQISLIKPIAIIGMLLLLAYIAYQFVTNTTIVKGEAANEKFSIKLFFSNIFKLFTGGTKAILGYGEISAPEHFANIFALLFVSILCTGVFWAIGKIIMIVLGAQTFGLEEAFKKYKTPELAAAAIGSQIKEKTYSNVISNLSGSYIFGVIGALFMVLSFLYLTIHFVPLLNIFKPLLLPLYSDYGYSTQEALNELLKQGSLLLGGKFGLIKLASTTNFASLIFMKTISCTLWISILPLLLYYLPSILIFVVKSYMRTKSELNLELEEERGRRAALETAQGAQILQAVRGSTIRK